MPVIDQIAEVSDRIFDTAENTNERARTAAGSLVTRIQEADLPFAERMQKVSLPLVDRLPEPADAVDATFDFIGSGIEFNRNLAERLVERFSEPAAEAVTSTPAPKTTAAKKPAAKKTTAKKTTAQK